MLKAPLLNLVLTFVGAAILITILARLLPRTSIYRRFILSTTNPPGPSLTAAPRAFASALQLAPGMTGRALTILRPSGKAEFGSRVVDVVTEGDFISPESTVAIVSTDGMRVVVKGVSQ
jgi:membrane-bound serine protease (ClpP class)